MYARRLRAAAVRALWEIVKAEMDKNELSIGQRVRYVPGHAHGDRGHRDCEDGIVRSFNPDGHPFVVYDNATRGKMLTLTLAQPWTAACTDPSDLVSLSPSGSGK